MAKSAARIDHKHSRDRLNSDLLDRMPPHSLDAERGVICSMLLDPAMCDDVAVILRPDDFHGESNRTLYSNLLDMHNDGCEIDMMLLVERLKQTGDLESVGGSSYLAEVLHAEAIPAHAVHYAELVRDKAKLRNLINASASVIRDAYDPTFSPRELLGQAEERIFAINDGRSNDQVSSIKDILFESFDIIDQRMRGGAATGLATGFKELDSMLGGFHENELIILAARPAMGKTALATNIAEHVAVNQGMGTLFVSLEMASLELALRMVCARGHIEGDKFRKGFASGEDHEKFAKVTGELSSAPIYIDDTPSRTMTEIGAVARRIQRREGLGLIVIDYLQLISPDNPADPRQEQVSKIARRLKGLARELHVPILCLAQLNRQSEAAAGNIPKLSHLRESGAIEQDADVVMFVHREEYYCSSREEAEEKGLVGKGEIIVAKQRNGPTGTASVAWLGKYTQFTDIAPAEQYNDIIEFDGADSGF